MNHLIRLAWLALTILGVALMAYSFSTPGNQLLAAGVGGFATCFGFTMLMGEVR